MYKFIKIIFNFMWIFLLTKTRKIIVYEFYNSLHIIDVILNFTSNSFVFIKKIKKKIKIGESEKNWAHIKFHSSLMKIC